MTGRRLCPLRALLLGIRLFAVQTRGSAVRLEEARAQAMAEGRRLAQARERSAQLDKTGARRRAQLTRLYLESKKP
jgi:hypothetical protein